MRAYFALVLVLVAGCSHEESHPPELTHGPAVAESGLTCGDLRDAGVFLGPVVPGTLTFDGGAAPCVASGLGCPLVDPLDGGSCDGGSDAAVAYATCNGTEWVGSCQELDVPDAN